MIVFWIFQDLKFTGKKAQQIFDNRQHLRTIKLTNKTSVGQVISPRLYGC